MQIGSTIQLGESIPAGAFETPRYAKIDSQDTAPASTVTSRGQDQKSVDKSVAFLLCFQKMLSLSTLVGSWGHTMSSMSQWTQSGFCPEPSGSQPKLVSTSGQLQRTPRYHTARRCEKSGYLPCSFHTNNDQPWPTRILKIWRKWFYSLGLRFRSSVTHFRRPTCLIKSTSFLATSFSKNNHNQLTATCINLPFKAPSAKELFVGRISEICQPLLQFILGQRYEIVEGAKNVLGWHWLILAKRLIESAREAVDHGRPCSETLFRNCVSTCFNYAQETLLRKSTMLDQPWRRNSSTLCGKCSTSTHTTCCLDPLCSGTPQSALSSQKLLRNVNHCVVMREKGGRKFDNWKCWLLYGIRHKGSFLFDNDFEYGSLSCQAQLSASHMCFFQ